MNFVIQLLFSILRTISHNFQFNSSTEGSISKFLFEIAHSASSSTDMDALKFWLVQCDKFYGGEQQEDGSKCLMMLIELINKGSVPCCGSNDNNSTVSLSEILFSFMLEKYIVCDACGLRSPSFESSSMLYITPTCTSSMQELIKQGMEQKLEKSCFRCKTNTWHVESNYILQPPKYLIIVVNRFRYINNNFSKDRCSIPMDMTVVLGLHEFSLQGDHISSWTIYVFWSLYCIYVAKEHYIATTAKLRSLKWLIPNKTSTAYVVMYKLIT